jgi:gliding motility-associated-like protein
MTSDTGIVDTICSGSVFSYTPQTSVSGATFSWTRYAVAGIEEFYATGEGSIEEQLTNSTDIPVLVAYEYIIGGSGACSLSDTVIIEVLVYPVSRLTLSHYPGNGSVVVLGTPITIVSEPSGALVTNYIFRDERGRSFTVIDSVGSCEFLIYDFDEGVVNSIEITAENEYGCTVTGIETFEALYNLPNVITPRETTNNRLLRNYDVQVFSRWGSELYRGTDGWDGSYKGSPVASGTYFYVLRYVQPGGKSILLKRSVFVKY